ncbi:MAG: metallophosphoesterase family protein [Promethearchaeota archaeon]
MTASDSSVQSSNKLKEILNRIATKNIPDYVFEWFFRYFAGGPKRFKSEPVDLLENYMALISAAKIMLKHKYDTGIYGKIIKDTQTPHWTYYFVGDTHGSFQDTYTMIDYFIKVFQINPYIKIVFLGDYVDRNPFDLQNLAFIISFWLLFHENVFILRGNHEDSSVCSRYGFSQHLFEKSGSKDRFTPIWDSVNTLFSKLPVGISCLIGEKRILALHGGFPFDVNQGKDYTPINLELIEPQLNCFQEEHFEMDKYSQTILWADPDPDNLPDGGVAPSPRTGRPRFSQQAFQSFMDLNKFDILIRAHQKFTLGYKLLWQNRLISLFSTSTYDGKLIGKAKFLRLQPKIKRFEIGDEEIGEGFGILAVDPEFLEKQLHQYYHAATNA